MFYFQYIFFNIFPPLFSPEIGKDKKLAYNEHWHSQYLPKMDIPQNNNNKRLLKITLLHPSDSMPYKIKNDWNIFFRVRNRSVRVLYLALFNLSDFMPYQIRNDWHIFFRVLIRSVHVLYLVMLNLSDFAPYWNINGWHVCLRVRVRSVRYLCFVLSWQERLVNHTRLNIWYTRQRPCVSSWSHSMMKLHLSLKMLIFEVPLLNSIESWFTLININSSYIAFNFHRIHSSNIDNHNNCLFFN